MPIISFNISNHLKQFLKRMVGTEEYKNNSRVLRDALVRLMHEKEEGAVDSIALNETAIDDIIPKLSSSIMISIDKFNSKLEHKINRLENDFHNAILHKSTFCHEDKKTVLYIVEDTMANIQNFITELNGFEELLAFRYIINEPESQ